MSNRGSLLEFIEEVPEILQLGLDEGFDLRSFLEDFLCGCRDGLVGNLGEVGCATSVPSQDLSNILVPAKRRAFIIRGVCFLTFLVFDGTSVKLPTVAAASRLALSCLGVISATE